jgi:hypothetical protein
MAPFLSSRVTLAPLLLPSTCSASASSMRATGGRWCFGDHHVHQIWALSVSSFLRSGGHEGAAAAGTAAPWARGTSWVLAPAPAADPLLLVVAPVHRLVATEETKRIGDKHVLGLGFTSWFRDYYFDLMRMLIWRVILVWLFLIGLNLTVLFNVKATLTSFGGG